MIFTPTKIPDVIIIDPKVIGDDRGFFFESFSDRAFRAAIGRPITFVQDNHSRSHRGVLRGLHYQLPPRAQGKLVRVVAGEVFDVAIDIRRSSPTFGKWVSQILSESNRKQLWIPPGFAHGFMTLSESADVLYKTTEFYYPESERCILWSDPSLGIRWPSPDCPSLSKKDSNGQMLKDADVFID
jgi:dTDP-4-dehydrorhamnose 3,5-epimerase